VLLGFGETALWSQRVFENTVRLLSLGLALVFHQHFIRKFLLAIYKTEDK